MADDDGTGGGDTLAGGGADTVAGGADTLAGGGADTVAGGANTLGGGAGFKWEGLDPELEGFVKGKSPADIAKEGFAHKQSATRRAEQILKESGALLPPAAGAELEFFGKFAPEDAKAYGEAAKDILGPDAGASGGVMMEAAKAGGLHPAQFKAFIAAAKAGNEAAQAAQGQAFEVAIAADWGGNRATNTAMVERAAKLIAPGMAVDEVIAALVAVNPKGDAAATVRQLNVLRDLGARLEEGVIDPAGEAGKVALQDEHKTLKAAAVAAGGISNLPAAQQARLAEIQKEVSKNG